MIVVPPLYQRLGFGLVQGLLLYFLLHAAKQNAWPATDRFVFAPLFEIATVAGGAVLLLIHQVRLRTLLIWGGGLAAAMALLALYDMSRRSGLIQTISLFNADAGKIYPSMTLDMCAGIGIFIAQSLVIAGDQEGRFVASYPRYFDVAWKLAIQISFMVLFVLLFWLILWLGGGMFKLINITFFVDLFEKDWFNIPMTALANAAAVHVTDVRPGLVRGYRTLKLATLSWLAPVLTGFVACFLVAVPFKGLDLLWKTHHTSQIMLAAVAWLVVLINAVYQDGTPEHEPAPVLRHSTRLAAILVLPLVVIGMFALGERVDSFGWTVHMIDVAACYLVTLCYACGYLAAAVRRGGWLKGIERTNIATAFVVIATLASLLTPLADPARLAVNSQIARLRDGRIAMDKFDFMYLRNFGEAYGENELRKMKADADASSNPAVVAVRDKIANALSAQPQYNTNVPPPPKMTGEDVQRNIQVYPEGRVLPDSFMQTDWLAISRNSLTPTCLNVKGQPCEAFILPDDGSGAMQVILISAGTYSTGVLLRNGNDGWQVQGILSNILNCKGVREALRAGAFKLVPPSVQDIEAAGQRIQVTRNQSCPQE